MLKKLSVLVLAILLVIGINDTAFAYGPVTRHSSAYDYTQANIPYVNYTSYFDASITNPPGGEICQLPQIGLEQGGGPCWINWGSTALYAGQSIGILCWTVDRQNGSSIVDKIAFGSGTGSGFRRNIGYYDDNYVVLTYANRINYVPHC